MNLKLKSDLPAMEGGRPVREDFLIFGKPAVGEEEIEAVVDTLRTGWISTGNRVVQFAKAFREYTGSPYAVATNSCSSALHLSLAAIGVGPGDEVITTPMTFAATANTIVHLGATPIFADIQPHWFNIDPREIEAKISPRTKAILPVHFAGLSCDMDEILAIAKKHRLSVVEDAAHAVGCEYKGKKIGTLGDYTCFSFYVTKNMTTAEGGMVTTPHEDKAEMMERMSLHGLDLDAWQRYSTRGFKHYDVIYPGYKFNMTDIAASMGLVQLGKLEEFIALREEYAAIYSKELESLDGLVIPDFHDHGRHAWHLYPILLDLDRLKIDRDRFLEALHWENIGAGVHYRAVHLQKYYRERFSFRYGDYPNAEYVSDRVLSLPLSCAMTPDDVYVTVEAVKKVIRYYLR